MRFDGAHMTPKAAAIQLARLRCRTPSDVRALHYLKRRGGVVCLDVGIEAATLAELNQLVQTAFERLHPCDLLPASSDNLWLELLESKEYTRFLLEIRGGLGRAFVVVHDCEGG